MSGRGDHIREVVYGARLGEFDVHVSPCLLEHDECLRSDILELGGGEVVEWVVVSVPRLTSTSNTSQPHVDWTMRAAETNKVRVGMSRKMIGDLRVHDLPHEVIPSLLHEH